MSKAVILISGGLDSATTAALARDLGFDLYGMTFRYGQRHAVEVEAAKRVAGAVGLADHVIVDIDPLVFHGSSLVSGGDVPPDVPKDRSDDDISVGIPSTYVPARNTIFLSYALAWAEVLGTGDIFIGVNALDYSGYPDCRPDYVAAFQAMANLATRDAVEGRLPVTIHTPLIEMSKADIIGTGLALGVDYGMTTSCYDPAADGAACGRCDSCQLRLKGFAGAGIGDPIAYQDIPDRAD